MAANTPAYFHPWHSSAVPWWYSVRQGAVLCSETDSVTRIPPQAIMDAFCVHMWWPKKKKLMSSGVAADATERLIAPFFNLLKCYFQYQGHLGAAILKAGSSSSSFTAICLFFCILNFLSSHRGFCFHDKMSLWNASYFYSREVCFPWS